MPSLCKLSLTIIVSCLFLAGCTDQASISKAKALESELEQISRLNSQAQASLKRLDSKVEAGKQENAKLQEENAKLQEALDAKTKDVELLKKEFENFKLKYKLSMKTRVPGMHVEDLTVDGATYHNVILKEMTDAWLSIVHDNGVRKLGLAQLPDSLRDRLGLNMVLQEEAPKAPELDAKKVKLAIMVQHDQNVNNADQQRQGAIEELRTAKNKLITAKNELQTEMQYPDSTRIKPLKAFIVEQEAFVVRLESKFAQADLKAYEARQQRTNMPR